MFSLYTYVKTISKDIGINKEKEICPPSKESISDHKCERTDMVAKCEMLMNNSRNFIDTSPKTTMNAKQGIHRES